ncbi:MAG: hypothetical protein EBE86_011420 [Hormoscilla sp. GUM202]|nr:hypothetical protein [Hormoscilla sp. GUM202]
MTENRLELIDPELSAYLLSASIAQQRYAAAIACEFALAKTGISATIIDEGLEAIKGGVPGNEMLRSRLESFINQLDEKQWDLQEKMAEGKAQLETYIAAFQKARAVNSLYYALNPDAFTAATESLYEAQAATEDLATLKSRILLGINSLLAIQSIGTPS